MLEGDGRPMEEAHVGFEDLVLCLEDVEEGVE